MFIRWLIKQAALEEDGEEDEEEDKEEDEDLYGSEERVWCEKEGMYGKKGCMGAFDLLFLLITRPEDDPTCSYQ